MKVTKFIATLLLSLGIALAGVPALAQPCPMGKMAQMQHNQKMDMQDCKGCAKAAKQEPEKNGGCDAADSAKCSSMSGGAAMNLPAEAELPAIGEQAKWLYPAGAAIASAHLNSQERPPKSFA